MPTKPQAARLSLALLASFIGTARPPISWAAEPATPPTVPAHSATVNAGAVGADLSLSPKRVVFDPATRSATVFVFNEGATSGVYRVELVDEIMRPDGRIEKVVEATDSADAAIAGRLKSAKDLMLVTPHRVRLGPRESQTVRLRLQPPNVGSGGDGSPGEGSGLEYRTHLVISALPPEDMGLSPDKAAQSGANRAADGGQAVSVKVFALYSMSIPLIYRQGPLDARGHIDHLVLSAEDGHSVLDMDLVRDGANSLFGAVEARVGGPRGEVIGIVKGVSVYPEIDHRHSDSRCPAGSRPGSALPLPGAIRTRSPAP